jgi:hypothetical protein
MAPPELKTPDCLVFCPKAGGCAGNIRLGVFAHKRSIKAKPTCRVCLQAGKTRYFVFPKDADPNPAVYRKGGAPLGNPSSGNGGGGKGKADQKLKSENDTLSARVKAMESALKSNGLSVPEPIVVAEAPKPAQQLAELRVERATLLKHGASVEKIDEQIAAIEAKDNKQPDLASTLAKIPGAEAKVKKALENQVRLEEQLDNAKSKAKLAIKDLLDLEDKRDLLAKEVLATKVDPSGDSYVAPPKPPGLSEGLSSKWDMFLEQQKQMLDEFKAKYEELVSSAKAEMDTSTDSNMEAAPPHKPTVVAKDVGVVGASPDDSAKIPPESALSHGGPQHGSGSASPGGPETDPKLHRIIMREKQEVERLYAANEALAASAHENTAPVQPEPNERLEAEAAERLQQTRATREVRSGPY